MAGAIAKIVSPRIAHRLGEFAGAKCLVEQAGLVDILPPIAGQREYGSWSGRQHIAPRDADIEAIGLEPAAKRQTA